MPADEGAASFYELFENAPCGYVVLDLDGAIVLANAAFRELAAMNVEEVIGVSFRSLLGLAGAIFFDTQLLPTLLLSGRRKEIALDLRTKTGRVPVLVNFRVQYEQGRPASIRAVLLDATERRLFERQLLRSRNDAEQLAEVITHSSDAVITTRSDGTIQHWNNGATKMLGHTSAEVSGKSLAALILSHDLGESLQEAITDLSGGQEYSGEILVLRKDGTELEASIKLTPHMEAPGRLVAYSAVLRDISRQKMAERALLQAEKLASVGRLASSIAHEINNPLEAVTNLLYILETQTQSAEQKTFIKMAQEELSRVSQITTHTLRFHRQSSNRTDLDIAGLFESVIGLYRGRLRNAQITPDIRCRALRRLRCHEGELRQIVLNVVGNAVDALKSGGTLHLRCRDSTDRLGKAGIRIIIADNGTGMDAVTLARIFEPFFSTKGIGGTGLGLWVTQDLVQKNKGRLNVRTSIREDCHGTIFGLFFPHIE